MDFEFKNSKYKSESLNDLGLLIDKRFTGSLNIPNEIIQRVVEKKFWQKYYLQSIKRRLKEDSILIEEIKVEIKE